MAGGREDEAAVRRGMRRARGATPPRLTLRIRRRLMSDGGVAPIRCPPPHPPQPPPPYPSRLLLPLPLSSASSSSFSPSPPPPSSSIIAHPL
eukprot:2319804-Pyramimonas_sp.AAC.1